MWKQLERLTRLMVVLALAACGPSDPSGRAQPISALNGDAARGGPLFTQQCASCHGANGKGDAASGASDLTPLSKKYTTFMFASVVVNGSGRMPPMPALKDQEVADIVAYIKATF
jgi:mono/diheme cytochrome c family protein